MDLDFDIENVEFPDDEKRVQESTEVSVELENKEQTFLEDESFTIQNDLFDKITKNLIFERLHSKNKRIQGKSNLELDLSGVPPSIIYRIHEAKG
jgi:hypothetical protein